MQQFDHTVRDPLGIHARPAGLLAKIAKEFPDTEITVTRGDVSAKASQLLKLMGMGVRNGDRITVSAEGPAEKQAIAAMQRFFSENL